MPRDWDFVNCAKDCAQYQPGGCGPSPIGGSNYAFQAWRRCMRPRVSICEKAIRDGCYECDYGPEEGEILGGGHFGDYQCRYIADLTNFD